MTDLLPPNATPEERALTAASARLGLPDTALLIDTLWSPWDCPETLLPWLAWALAVDVWDAGWDVETKRRVIAFSFALRRRAGTVWAVREALKASGLADARLTECVGHWAGFDLEVDLGETTSVTAVSTATLLRLLYNAKPASRHLRSRNYAILISDEFGAAEDVFAARINAAFEDMAHFGVRHNGLILRDGTRAYENAAGDMNDDLDFEVIHL